MIKLYCKTLPFCLCNANLKKCFNQCPRNILLLWTRVLGLLGVPFMSKSEKAFTGLRIPFVQIASIKLNLSAEWITLC